VTSADRAVRCHAVVRASGVGDELPRLLLNELGAIRVALQAHELARRRSAVAAVHECLHRLRSVDTMDELAAQVPGNVATLGFNRAMFSWLDQARWVPQSVHTASGPDEARAVMEAGRPPYWHTRDLLEAEMIRHRRSLLVREALDNPHVHQGIQAVMHSRSYVAAPLISGSTVVAFVHADQNVDNGAVDEFDRGLVALFTEGLGLAFERVRMIEELAAVRSRLGQQSTALRDLMSELDATEFVARPAIRASQHPPETPSADPTRRIGPIGSWCEELTRREQQVLQLLASGLSNAQIADRLYITEGTSKTHVKHVLRKLGAETRAQAGAMFHRHNAAQRS